MIVMRKFSMSDSSTQLWILLLLCFMSSGGFSLSETADDKELETMKRQWEQCCRSNKSKCIRGSCYTLEWRAASWSAVRSRCRGRYSDWPFAVDIMKVQEEKDIEALWTLLSMGNAYPFRNSALPITVWTSGTSCPQREPSGAIVSTNKWASNQPFPSWLQEKLNGSASDNISSSDDGCKFLVITPKANRTAAFHFEDENAKHAAVCEFLFPGIFERTRATTTATVATTRSDGCAGNSAGASGLCDEETDSTVTITASFSIADTTIVISSEEEVSTQSTTPSIFTDSENSSIDGKNVMPTTDISDEYGSGTFTTPTGGEVTESTDFFSDETGPEMTADHSEYSTVSVESTSVSAETTSHPTELTTTPSDSTTASTIITSTTASTDHTTTTTAAPNTSTTTDSTAVTTTDSTTSTTTDSSTSSDSTTASAGWHSVSTSLQRTTESDTRTSEGLNDSIGCKGRNASGIQWPATPPGAMANESCPKGMTGYAQWRCDEKTLRFVPKKPLIHQCRHVWINKLEDEINENGNAVKISSELANKTKDNTLSHGDIAAVVEMAESLMELFTKQKQEKEVDNQLLQVSDMTYNFTKTFVATYSNVLRSEHVEAWGDLPEVHQRKVASKILRHTERVGQFLSCIKMTDDNVQYTVLEDNINLQTFMFNSTEKRNTPYVFPKLGTGVSSTDKIELPADMIPDMWPASCGNLKTAVGIVYKNVGQFLKEDSMKETDSNVSSSVLGFTLGNSSTRSIKLPEGLEVSILLKHTTPPNESSAVHKAPRCVFWNFSRGQYGDWDDSGCRVAYSDFYHTQCNCNHLTNFAILMDVNNNVGRKDFVLETMTYVCCGLSAVALIFTVICLTGIRSLRCRRSTITSNLCACLLLMNVIVLFGLDRTENQLLCAVIAGFLQYSVLAAFCWMLLEGYQLYQMVVLVFCSSSQISMVYLYIFGYGAPFLIVGISAGIRYEDYGGPDFCWLSNASGLMWSFVGPACFIILVNVVVFIMTIKSASSVKIRKEQKMADKVRGWVKGSFSILCLLGLTWCTGLFYMAKSFYPTAYVFTLLNGLQGIFIFVFHVLLNDKAGNVFRKMFKKEIVRQTTKSTFFTGTSSELRRGQAQSGTSINGEVRSSRALSQQNSRPNSASSNGVPSSIGAAIPFSQESRMSAYHTGRANAATKCARADGLRKKSSSLGVSKDIPQSCARGVVRQVQRANYGF